MALSDPIDIFIHVKPFGIGKFCRKFSKMNLPPLILLFGLFQTILGEIFTTGFEVKELVKLERDLIDSLTTYFERQKKNGITFDSSITG